MENTVHIPEGAQENAPEIKDGPAVQTPMLPSPEKTTGALVDDSECTDLIPSFRQTGEQPTAGVPGSS